MIARRFATRKADEFGDDFAGCFKELYIAAQVFAMCCGMQANMGLEMLLARAPIEAELSYAEWDEGIRHFKLHGYCQQPETGVD